MQSILAVDDSPSMRKMVSFTLSGAGYHVVEAVDGQDALEKAQSHAIDLVLVVQLANFTLNHPVRAAQIVFVQSECLCSLFHPVPGKWGSSGLDEVLEACDGLTEDSPSGVKCLHPCHFIGVGFINQCVRQDGLPCSEAV